MVLLLVASLAVARVAVAVRVAVLVTHGGKLSTLGNVRSIGKNFLVADPLALVLLVVGADDVDVPIDVDVDDVVGVGC